MQKCIKDDANLSTPLIKKYCENNAIGYRMARYLDEHPSDVISAMDSCWSSIFWSKYNLVFGPTARSDDPGEKVDENILSKQSEIYIGQMRTLIAQYNTAVQKDKGWSIPLKTFLSLRPTNNVQWVQDGDKWKVGR
jgi:hypothetical protein